MKYCWRYLNTYWWIKSAGEWVLQWKQSQDDET